MIINLLTNVIIWVYDRFKNIISGLNYEIIDQSMEYYIDNNVIPEELDDFWEDESREWDGSTESFYKDLNGVDYKNTSIPNNVLKTIIRIKYWFNGKMYKYLTYDMNHTWPPEKTPGIVFNIPIVSAVLLDSYDKPKKDMLNKIKRYAGPRGDFYGKKDIKISDMLYYDKDTLENRYVSIKLKNALGMNKIINTSSGFISELRVP
tara:strand:- start:182 stop:796 length:615 start_codon:yes stop_codon:yes gene_type:complete